MNPSSFYPCCKCGPPPLDRYHVAGTTNAGGQSVAGSLSPVGSARIMATLTYRRKSLESQVTCPCGWDAVSIHRLAVIQRDPDLFRRP
jgi:hypothetical protein